MESSIKTKKSTPKWIDLSSPQFFIASTLLAVGSILFIAICAFQST